MSGKRSERLRSLIASTVTDAADNAAPVTVTGSGMMIAPISEESRVKRDVSEDQLQETNAASDVRGEGGMIPTPMPAPEFQRTVVFDSGEEVEPALRAPQRLPKIPKWQKANVTLEPEDLSILELSDSQARHYGFKLRRGGNPSLFVRAGLRLLDQLREQEPETWIQRIAATIRAEDR